MPQQYVVNWSGGRIGSGASVLHFESIGSGTSAQTIADAVRAWMFARQASFPNDITFTFSPEVKEISNTGTLLAVYPVIQPVTFLGTNTGDWSNGAGRMIRLTTNVITGGRRLQGRIYWVPSAAVVGNDGNVTSALVANDQTAHNAFLATLSGVGANLAVWSRTAAVTAPVTGMVTVPRPATLRTRNDR